MKRVIVLIGMVSLVMMMSGCATSMFERQTSLKLDPFSRTYDYSSVDFEVLGQVEATGNSKVVMGMVTAGRDGYGLLMQAARKKYGTDVTTVMFIFSDYSYVGVLYPVVGRITTTYAGVAVKAKTISHTANVRVKAE